MRDQVRVVLGDTPDDRSTPIVAADDDALDSEAFCETSDRICVVFQAVVPQICRVSLLMNMNEFNGTRCVTVEKMPSGSTDSVAISHRVQCDASKLQLEQQRDLVSPAKRQVREAVNQDHDTLRSAFRDGIEVA